jgi:hypothetical protein
MLAYPDGNVDLPLFSSELVIPSKGYRIAIDYWVTSHLKTYRQALWKNAPI